MLPWLRPATFNFWSSAALASGLTSFVAAIARLSFSADIFLYTNRTDHQSKILARRASDSESFCAGLVLQRGTWQKHLEHSQALHLDVRLRLLAWVSLCCLRSALDLARFERWWFIIFLATRTMRTKIRSPSTWQRTEESLSCRSCYYRPPRLRPTPVLPWLLPPGLSTCELLQLLIQINIGLRRSCSWLVLCS